MAVTAILDTRFGEERELYIRLNSFDQLANHGVKARARFRGFLSKEAFEAGAHFVWEAVVPFDANAPEQPWVEAYAALRAYDPSAPLKAERDRLLTEREPIPAKLEKARADREAVKGRNDIPTDSLDSNIREFEGVIAQIDTRLAQLAPEIAAAERLREALARATDA